MAISFSDRLKHAWNAFTNKDPTEDYSISVGGGGAISYGRPDRPRLTRGNERSIITAVYNRIAMDVASITINHVRLDDNDHFKEIIPSSLNDCFTLNANKDQTGRAFVQDIVLSMLDEGCVAIVPVDTNINPKITGSYDILSMRTGKIVTWYPDHVRVSVYNDRKGYREEVTLPKSMVAIVENPLYAVMNESNSTMQRLIRKLNLLDIVDEKSGSDKLDLILQVPYAIKGDLQRQRADKTLRNIESQLKNSPYGIAYVDGTERITQLNRSVENNLLKQVEYLTNMLYGQLGISAEVMNGTADEKQMLNYNNRTIEPIISAIVDAMRWKFLTKTARTKKQTIMFFRDPFKLVPVNDIAEIADKFTRNEIMTSNEFRQVVGMKPADDPKADQLVNANISQPTDESASMQEESLVDDTETSAEQPMEEPASIMDLPVSALR